MIKLCYVLIMLIMLQLKADCGYLQVSCELAVFLDGLLVICHSLLRSLNSFLSLSNSRGAQIQHLPQLQLRLSGVLLQLIVHLIYSFLKDEDIKRTGSVSYWIPFIITTEHFDNYVSWFLDFRKLPL